jgi:DNA-binding response OmpR family regulator
MKKRILIVEDEVDIITLIQNRLNADLFTIESILIA